MSPFPHPDRFDCFRDQDEIVPGFTGRFYDRVIAFEDPVREPIDPYLSPHVLDRFDLWRPRGQQDWRYVGRDDERAGGMRSCTIPDENDMRVIGEIAAISLTCAWMVSAFTYGDTIAAPVPRAGQIAPNR